MYRKKKNTATPRLIVLVLIVALALVAANSSFLPAGVQQAAASAFNQLSATGNFAVTLPRLFACVIAIAVCMLMSTVVTMVLSKVERRNRRMLTVSALVKSLVHWITAIAAVIWILSILGIDVSAALAGVGIVALVLSFGAQSLVEDVVTGIFIMFEGPFNVGDIIVLDSFRGVVRNVGVRTTTIEDDGGNLKIVNNSDIRNVQNRSCHPSVAPCDFSISYNASIPEAEKAIKNCLRRLWQTRKDLLVREPVYAGVQELADSAILLRVHAWCEECNIFATTRMINREVKLALDEAGIEIPFPQVVIHQAKD